jgi:alcohol dehydrogenase class IV
MDERNFDYESLPGRVVFGWGASRSVLPAQVETRGIDRILLVHAEAETPIAEGVTAAFRDRVVGVFADVRPHVPVEVARAARTRAAACGAEWLLSIGGGSTTGTAKAIALESGLPVIAVPTTYAGSEMTPIWGLTISGRKETGRDPKVLPQLVIYDPDLTLSLPRAVAIPSAFNALAHCVESFYAPRANPVTSLLAEEGLRALTSAVRRVSHEAEDRRGREDLLYGAYLAGSAFGVAGSGLHHKICHALGGRLDLPHAETHTAVLPQVLAFNEPAMPRETERIRRALAADGDGPEAGAAATVFDLIRASGATPSLAELGMPRQAVAGMVDEILAAVPADNPRAVSGDDVFEILEAAFEGRRPTEAAPAATSSRP